MKQSTDNALVLYDPFKYVILENYIQKVHFLTLENNNILVTKMFLILGCNHTCRMKFLLISVFLSRAG